MFMMSQRQLAKGKQKVYRERERQVGRSVGAPTAVSNGRAATMVWSHRSPGAVAVVGVIGSARSRRARDPVGRESAIADVVVVKRPPEERSPAPHLAINLAFVVEADHPLQLGGGPPNGLPSQIQSHSLLLDLPIVLFGAEHGRNEQSREKQQQEWTELGT